MKRILFRPFDLKKWLVLGFAAFIGGNWGGFGVGNFNPDAFKNARADNVRPHFHMADLGPWGMVALVVAIVLVVVLALVLTWVICRGRFVFADCVVKNRAAIVDPWHEFRHEGNSFFLFTLAVGFVSVLIIALLALVVLVPFGIFAHNRAHGGLGVGGAIAIGCVMLLWFLFAIFFAVVTQFMVPVMYRQRCRATAAFVQVATARHESSRRVCPPDSVQLCFVPRICSDQRGNDVRHVLHRRATIHQLGASVAGSGLPGRLQIVFPATIRQRVRRVERNAAIAGAGATAVATSAAGRCLTRRLFERQVSTRLLA